jgi:ParB family chromosome partitioning protein
MTDRRKALGRGLGALIPNLPRMGMDGPASPQGDGAPPPGGEAGEATRPAGPGPGSTAGAPASAASVRREFFLCPIEEIIPSSDNPRQTFSEERLEELATSIKAQGLVQPLVIRLRTPEEIQASNSEASFVLIAGERRWRASQKAGLKEVPVVVKDVSAARAFELALVENLQREDLNVIEEAEAYRRLSEEFGYTQEELSQRVGRARETVANSLRLLRLPNRVRHMVVQNELSMGHARALLSLDTENQINEVASKVQDKKLSVRQTETLIRKVLEQANMPPEPGAGEGEEAPKPQERGKTPAVRDLEERLQKALGTRVRLRVKDAQAGRIEIDYNSLDELDRLIARFLGSEAVE